MFAYTSLFGFFAAFLFLRTANLPAVITVHAFCNWQGFPRVVGRVGRDGASAASTCVYYALLPLGALAFYTCLWPLTASANALVEV
nr:putative caax prenyl protease 2 [Quercus suber]